MKGNWFSRFGGLVSVLLSVLVFGAVWSFGVAAEIPVGTLRGSAVMTPSGKLLPNAEVIAYPQFEVPEDSRSTWTTRTNEKGEFTFKGLPAGIYNVHAFGKAYSNQDAVVAMVKEGKAEEVRIETKIPYPDLDLHSNQRVFLPTEKISVTLTGYTEEPQARFEVFNVPYASVIEHRSPDNLVRVLTANKNDSDPTKAAGLKLQSREERPFQRKDVEGHFVEQINLNPQAEGLYLVRATVGKESRFSWISVTRIALVTKATPDRGLAFVTDLETGRPVTGAKVSAATAKGLVLLGQTVSDGTMRFAMPANDGDTKVLIADSGSSRAFTWFYAGDRAGGKTVLWAQTDRPVYRPGDTVQYKIVARDTKATGYSVTAGHVDVEVVDPDETVVQRQKLALSSDGTAHGSFQTDRQALPQAYQIRMVHGDSQDTHFVNLVSYRKPEFRVTVKPLAKRYIRGDNARFEVRVESYTGEPSPGMEVTGQLYQRADWSASPFEDEEYSDEYDSSDYMGEYVTDVQSKTDDKGTCIITVPTKGSQGEEQTLSDAVFTLEVDVQDASGRATSARGQVSVVRGLFDLDAVTDRSIVDPGQNVQVTLEAHWHEDGTPAQGQEVSVEYGHERWTKNKSVFVREGTQKVILGASGRASLTVVPRERGEFRVRAFAKDRRGNEIAAQEWVWVVSGGADLGGPVPDISLVLDKKSYSPTDHAKVLLRTAHPGGVALLTVEAEDVLWSKTVPLDQSSTVVNLEGLSQFAPNASVSVSYVRAKEYYSASKNINVSLVQKEVQVEVRPDRAVLGPGGVVNYAISTKDSQGRPVPASVALSVVDESLYAIAEDSNDPLKVFYPRRWSWVQTAYSFPTLYLDGEDKNPKAVRVRRNFQDTAFWNPEVKTNAQGQASVAVRLPDNLTEWRATATAITPDTHIGRARSSVTAKLDLMARWSLPMFLVEGDTQTVSVRLSNTTERGMKVPFTVEASNATLGQSQSDSADLAAGGVKEQTWAMTAGTLGTAKFKVTATEQGGTAGDAEEKTVPVLVRGRAETSSFVGETTSSAEGRLTLKDTAVDGKLVIQVAPTLLSSLVESLPSLVDYPYGCLEQTMSRFVPAVLVVNMMRKSGLRDPAVEAKLPQIVRDGLVRVKRMQNSEGAWGWWEYDAADSWMTAYALDGLWRVEQAGIDTSIVNKKGALDWAEERLKWLDTLDDYEASNRLALASAVLLYKKSPAAIKTITRIGTSSRASTSALAQAVVALKRSGAAPQLLTNLYKALLARAEETRDTMHWPESGWYEPTGAALEAVALMEPDSPRLTKLFRYLQSQRRGQAWTSTRDTARILMSASTYLARTQELRVDKDVRVSVNGRQVAATHFDSSSLKNGAIKVEVPANQLQKGPNTITFQSKGIGRIYFAATLNQEVRMQRMDAVPAADFSIERAFYRVSPQRLEDGSLRLVVGSSPTSTAKSGEVLRCRLTVTAKNPLSNIMAEVPIPSNMRIVDDEEPLDGATWSWWWARSVYTDDRAVFFGNVLPGKPQVIEFAVRAEAPGLSTVLPSSLYRMYQPDDKAWTSSAEFEVTAR